MEKIPSEQWVERIIELIDTKILPGIQKLYMRPLPQRGRRNNEILKWPLSHIKMMLVLQHFQKIRIGEIAEMLCIPLSTATEIASRLEKEGIIKRERMKENMRIVMISLTRKGTNIVRKWHRRRKEALKSITSEESREKLYSALISIAKVFEKLEGGIK